MNRDGSDKRIVYDGVGYEWGVSYSPDGRYIVFTTVSGATEQEELFIRPTSGGDLQQITNQGGLYATWLP
jgi:Tol biopolymer transport system component